MEGKPPPISSPSPSSTPPPHPSHRPSAIPSLKPARRPSAIPSANTPHRSSAIPPPPPAHRPSSIPPTHQAHRPPALPPPPPPPAQNVPPPPPLHPPQHVSPPPPAPHHPSTPEHVTLSLPPHSHHPGDETPSVLKMSITSSRRVGSRKRGHRRKSKRSKFHRMIRSLFGRKDRGDEKEYDRNYKDDVVHRGKRHSELRRAPSVAHSHKDPYRGASFAVKEGRRRHTKVGPDNLAVPSQQSVKTGGESGGETSFRHKEPSLTLSKHSRASWDPDREQEHRAHQTIKHKSAKPSHAEQVLQVMSKQVQHYPIRPGLEPLESVDAVYIQHAHGHLEVSLDVKIGTVYDICDKATNQRVYYAGELDTGNCGICCWGQHRPFFVHIFDAIGQLVMKIERRYSSSLCWFGSHITGSNIKIFLMSSDLHLPLGEIKQSFEFCEPDFDIFDAGDNLVMTISGQGSKTRSCCCIRCLHDNFNIWFADELEQIEGKSRRTDVPVGLISNDYHPDIESIGEDDQIGHAKENLVCMDFPKNLSPSLKAVLIGAIFCISISFYGHDRRQCNCTGCRVCLMVILIVVILLAVLCIYLVILL